MSSGIFPDWTWVMGFVLGAAIGSFLNVVVYRLPRRISLWNPSKSFCPICKHSLGPNDLVPLYSWLANRGRCYYCGAKVSSRYFWVEMLTGALFAGIWYRFLCQTTDGPRAVIFALAAAALVAALFIDFELFIIPDEINVFILFLGVMLAAITGQWTFMLWGAFTGWALLWGIAFLGRVALGKDAMGHGDIKLMRGVGAILGPLMTGLSLVMAVVVGLAVGIALLIWQRTRPAPVGAAVEPGDEGPTQQPAEELPPEKIGDLVVAGGWYLLCLDVVGVFFPGIYKWIGKDLEQEQLIEDDWKPSATTIPFGPYLALGSLVCMLFGPQVESLVQAYQQFAGLAPK